MCLKIGDDIALFKHLGTRDSAPKDIHELAISTSVEPTLLKRIARHLASRNVLTNATSAPDSYGATHISESLATREGSSGIRHVCNLYIPAFSEMPKFLKENNYRTPTDSRNASFQRRCGLQGLTLFECLQRPENKYLADDFNLLMKFTTAGRRSFVDVCEVGSLLRTRAANLDVSEHLLVDIGGGTGTDAAYFRAHVTDMPGLVELQELEGVIKAAWAAGIEDKHVSTRVHDFFTLQPVLASRFYFMGSVLHDWPDREAKRILENVAAAMKPRYSTLLLSENVLPSEKCHPLMSALDLTMMTTLASKERSEDDWQLLIGSAGLNIVKIHHTSSCSKSVLECELPCEE